MRFTSIFFSCVSASVLAVLAVSPAAAQGTRADYDRSESLDRRTVRLVKNDAVSPHWSADASWFWYSTEKSDGQRQAWIVDAVGGTQRVATEAERKAFGNVGLSDIGRPVPSTDSGGEAVVTFNNQSGRAVNLFWIDRGGQRIAYGSVAPGAKNDRGTFAGHVWLVADESGKTLGVFRAEEGNSQAIIPSERTRVPTGRRRSETRSDDAAPQANSPDGNWSAFVHDGTLMVKNTKTGAQTQLGQTADDTTRYEDALFWSPDSTHLVVNQTIEREKHTIYEVQSSPPDQLQPKLLSFTYYKPGDVLPLTKPHLFDIAGGGKEVKVDEALFDNPVYGENNHLRWDTDSQRFTFYYNQRGHQVARVVAVDAASGRASAIVEEKSDTFIDYYSKMYLGFVNDGELVWMSERNGWNHLYLYDAKTGRVERQLTNGEWAVRAVDHIDAKAGQIWFRAGGIDPKQDPYYLHECRVDLDGSHLVDLTPGDGTHKVQYSPDQKFFIDSYSRVDMPPVNELRRTSDGKLVCPLEKADASALLATGWRYPERFVAKARDGVTDIYGVIYRPTNFDPAKKYPVLEDIYAGPPGNAVPKAFGRCVGQVGMAELGFIVVQIDGLGTDFRSKAFQNYAWHNIADAGFADRILWIKSAAARHPEMDLRKGVGIYGTSAGGQNALGALELHNDFYTAAVADCGCQDNRMDKASWNEQYMGWPVGPWYEENSNVVHAKDLKGNLLLIVGELDHNVDPASTMQVVNALIKADKDFDLLVIPNAGHGQDGPYGTRRRKDFFVRHLLGVEPRHE